jgi:hypothetical protein
MHPLIQLKRATPVFLVALALACFGLSPTAQAVVPAPDGGYPGGNTAEGQAALLHLTTGGFNTAVGFLSLRSNPAGSFNTAVGAGTLLANTADENTATGAGALLSNTTGVNNTANGAFALFFNTTGSFNTAYGNGALFNNTTGGGNAAIGGDALLSNTIGGGNVALGGSAGSNATGFNNVYIGAGMEGVAGESNACYIASIFGQMVNPATGVAVFVDTNGKLGTVVSARRFKHDIKPMDKASEAILALKPVTFHYKSDATNTPCFGLVAEEVAEVNPNLIVRDKNGEILSVRYDQMNAMLLNEFLKEHRRVEQMQKQIEALTAGLQKVSTQLEVSKPAPRTVSSQ